MRLLKVAYLIALASLGGVSCQNSVKPQPYKTMCHVSRYYTSSWSTSPAEDENLADHWNAADIRFWAALGYRLVRSCASAQIQIEDEARLMGPLEDPESKIRLIVTLKTATRTEKIVIPYTNRVGPEDHFMIGKKFGKAWRDLMGRIDPTFERKVLELKHSRKHAEDNPNRRAP
jgi:hypothetical protein